MLYNTDYALEDKGYRKLEIDHNLFLYYTNRNTEGEFIVNNFLTESHVCIYSEEKFSNQPQYELMNQRTKYSCSSLPDSAISKDGRYQKIINYKKSDLYDDNELTYQLLTLPGFKRKHLQGELSLFARGYLHWADDCKISPDQSKVKTIDSISSDFGSIHKYYWFILIFILILLIINGVTLSSIRNSALIRYPIVVKTQVILILNYVAFRIIIYTQNSQNQLKDYVNTFKQDICSDNLTNAVLRENFRLFNKLEGTHNSILSLSKFFMYVMMVFSFVVFCPLIYRMILIKIKLLSI